MRGSLKRITADSAIGASGKPVTIYHISLKSGGTASVLALHHGTSTSDNEAVSMTGTASEGEELDFANGLFFPDGCYANVDANISYVTLWYEEHIK